ncbi:ATP-dependent DNA helicase PIF1 [Trichonephila clavipes]|nr:ATP-dependent DNA helicase PIF1 [Trichonephila clavipes]
MYSIEWQKRGLPHAHISVLLINKITPDQIYQIISAKIPDKHIDPNLSDVVTKNMIHGPCGAFNNNSPCMSDGKCMKRYSRKLVSDTITGNDGYPLHRQRSVEDGGKSVVLKVRNIDIEVDNRWIVSYSPLLSKTFKAHINVEYCNSVKSIKYICKYVNKGSDMAVFGVGYVAAPLDEINQYQLGRYISSSEAVLRILSFPIHERHPTVVHLAVHLENGQRVYFTADNVLPKFYTWNASTKKFQRRKQGKAVEGHTNLYSSDALGRLYTVHPNNTECFYLRLLLINIRGPISFQDLRTVNGQLYATYRQACQGLNLLENDAHWDTALADASNTARPQHIRTLFAIILATCFPSNPKGLWEKYKDYMSEDILHRLRAANQNPDIQFTPNVYNEALILIEDICLTIANKELVQLGMPASNRPANNLFDRDLQRETHYDSDKLGTFVRTNLPQLILEQRIAYDRIMRTITEQSGGLFFIEAPGGTGKTFLLSLILATIRSRNNIALAIASSGIEGTLLDGGRTTHSALKLPLNFQNTEAPTCNISKNSGMGKVLQTCQIIIWDECTMSHKKALEALDRTLRDFRGNRRIFGGALILLSGDFRQTLPIIPRSTPADDFHACLKSSVLWRLLQKLTLKTNMRLQLQRDASAGNFAKQFMDIGNGRMEIDESTQCITLPANFCKITESIDEYVQKVFPNIAQNYKNHQWLSTRAILAAKNIDVNTINFTIQHRIPSETTTYKSIDTVENQGEVVNYPTEFLNSLDLPGMPPHVLTLKIGVPIILLRNINPPRLSNGTRLSVKKMMNNVIEATILTGKFKGEDVLLPRIPMIPTDMPFEFKRLQFPVRLAFSVTINKAQGQSLQVCGLNLENPCFSHGQLYVACSRVGKPSDLFVYAPDGKTRKNCVSHSTSINI